MDGYRNDDDDDDVTRGTRVAQQLRGDPAYDTARVVRNIKKCAHVRTASKNSVRNARAMPDFRFIIFVLRNVCFTPK
jgi:hypothetical protein